MPFLKQSYTVYIFANPKLHEAYQFSNSVKIIGAYCVDAEVSGSLAGSRKPEVLAAEFVDILCCER